MSTRTPPEARRTRARRADDAGSAPRPARRTPDAAEITADRRAAVPKPRTAAEAQIGQRSGAAKARSAAGPAEQRAGARKPRTAAAATTDERGRTRKPRPRAAEGGAGGTRTAPQPAGKPASRTAPSRTAPRKGTPGRGAAAPNRKAPPRMSAVAPRTPHGAPPRTPFVLLIVGLLGGALVSLLLLNTVLAQDAFTLTQLQRSNQQLSERKQALQEDIEREGSPAVLHANARNLGMVDMPRPAYIDARTGRVTEGGARPPGVPDDVVAAAAGAAVTGAPGAIVPPVTGTVPPWAGRVEGGRR